jgi:hypothetical protein
MEAITINQFPIRDYLAGSGIYPAKDNGNYGMYHTPFRKDLHASMKVDYIQNVWFDFGTIEGGTLVDLVMRMENCSNGKAMQLLEQKISGKAFFSFHGKKDISPDKQGQSIIVHKTGVLTNPSLLGYLRERCINIEIARLHCEEIHFSVNGKPYFAVGFKNDKGGYALRNKYFKGCTNLEITSVKAGWSNCQLFEGFMDYLSFLTMKNQHHSNADVIILNSVSNMLKVKNSLNIYESVTAFLDNDDAGKRAVQELKSVCKKVSDQAVFYREYKDLNDYLCGKKLLPVKQVRKGFRL